MEIIIWDVIDSATKLISALCAALTLLLVWRKALPQIDEIHKQTNSLAQENKIAAHALGLKEGIEQSMETAQSAQEKSAATIRAAAKIAADEILAAAKLAKEDH